MSVTICEHCNKHFVKRYRLTSAGNTIPTVNIPKTTLQTLHADDLNVLKNDAALGKQLCSDCKKLCLNNWDECRITNEKGQTVDPVFFRDFIRKGNLDTRMVMDSKVVDDITNEIKRRQNIQNIVNSFKKN